MNRRTLLISLATLVLGPNVSASTGRHERRKSLVHEIRRAAERVVQEGQGVNRAVPAIRLCRVLAGECAKSGSTSPAIVQGTLDACQRFQGQQSSSDQSSTFYRSLIEFDRVGRRFIASVA